MASILSVLWIGRAQTLADGRVADAPTLDVVWEPDADAAAALAMGGFDVVVVAAAEAGAALRDLRALRRARGVPPVLACLDSREAGREPELRAAGAADVLWSSQATPGDGAAALLTRVEEILRDRVTDLPRRARRGAPELIGASAKLHQVLALIGTASRSEATVLLTGETGTGKELVARSIHVQGTRRGPFLAVNCAAFPDTLLESELFGHQRGAFTGAERETRGLFLEASRGTLFLDEVGDTSPSFQAKLLRVLQEREVRPVGGTRSRPVDARVIAATNRELWRETREGRFRDDLYFRLAVFPIHIPPLRERPEDVIPLAEHFLERHGASEGKTGMRLSREAVRLLQTCPWPGNARELENEIQRALALAETDSELTPAHFSERLTTLIEPLEARVEPGDTLRETLGRIEAWLLRRALDAHDGRRAATARTLGITREGLYKKMKRLNVE